MLFSFGADANQLRNKEAEISWEKYWCKFILKTFLYHIIHYVQLEPKGMQLQWPNY